MKQGTINGILSVAGLIVFCLPGCNQSDEAPVAPSQPPLATAETQSENKADPEPEQSLDVPESTVTVDVNARRPARKLSEYGLFSDLEQKVPAVGVEPYQLNAHSFVDHATQDSLVYIPSGSSATYQPDNALKFPIGTVLIQNIRFPVDEQDAAAGSRLLETRLLLNLKKGWTAVPYLWNDEGTDAERAVIGEKSEVIQINANGESRTFTYLTPNMNECKRCHVNEDVMYPIGVTAANLNRSIEIDGQDVNQLVSWQERGMLSGVPNDHSIIPQIPDWHDESSATVERRARSWLDVNCSHCHNPRGAASTSGLDLTFQQDQPVRFGVFKPPVAAGRGSQGLKFSILPQKPDESFMVRRIDSTELGVMMPPLGRSTVHHAGVELIRQWISEMEVDEALAEAARNPMKAYKAALEGDGNAERGYELFHKVQKCISCHTVGDQGGSVGPNLSDVGKRVKRDYMLESIVVPSAKIVKGFETQIVVTMEGKVVTGVVQSEDEYEIVIGDAKAQTKIQKDDIDERIVSDVSTMPTLANLLSVDDVRDLIAYLETLQTTPDGQATPTPPQEN